MQWIGLTGGIASGKSSVSRLLKERGYPVVDADQMARLAVSPGSEGLKKVTSTFGESLLQADGSLDRKALGKIVFTDADKRLELEKLLHPLIQKETGRQKQRLEGEGWPAAFYDVPLLFEKSLQDQFDATVLVYCSAEIQKQRLMKRDGLSETETEQRLAAQLPIAQKKTMATFVIDNEGPEQNLQSQVEAMLIHFGLPLDPNGPNERP